MTRVHLRRRPLRNLQPEAETLVQQGNKRSALLTPTADDLLHRRDREAILACIRDDAAHHDGRISVNRVRRALTGRIALPQLIGSTYSSLARSGVIRVAGWEVSDNVAGHHRGTVIRTWRLVERRSM